MNKITKKLNKGISNKTKAISLILSMALVIGILWVPCGTIKSNAAEGDLHYVHLDLGMAELTDFSQFQQDFTYVEGEGAKLPDLGNFDENPGDVDWPLGYDFVGWMNRDTEEIIMEIGPEANTDFYLIAQFVENGESQEDYYDGSDDDDDYIYSPAIYVSKTSVKKGKKTTVKITSQIGASIKISADNDLAKKALKTKKIKVKNGGTGKMSKLIFSKKTKKGKYKFIAYSEPGENFSDNEKMINITVK